METKKTIISIMVSIAVGVLVILAAYHQRGYMAVGFEWVAAPLTFVLLHALNTDEEEDTEHE